MNQKEKILKMLEEGKISADEAGRLLEAIGKKKNETKPQIIKAASTNNKKNLNIKGKLRIKVNSADGDKVNIAIPLKLAMIAKNFIPKNAQATLNDEGINIGEIINNLDSILDSVDEDIVNVESANGDNVRIFIDKE